MNRAARRELEEQKKDRHPANAEFWALVEREDRKISTRLGRMWQAARRLWAKPVKPPIAVVPLGGRRRRRPARAVLSILRAWRAG